MIGVLFLAVSAGGQVIKRDDAKFLKTIKAGQADNQTEVKVWVIPAAVTLAGGRSEQGRFLIVSEPHQKLYWWRFEAGIYPAGSTFPADEFVRQCRVHLADRKLVVFCTISRNLVVGASSETYSTESAIPELVASQFNRRAAQLDTGLDYFDKAINLWMTVGSDFFLESGRADASPIGLQSVTRTNDGWQVTVAGSRQRLARITLSSDFSLQESLVLP